MRKRLTEEERKEQRRAWFQDRYYGLKEINICPHCGENEAAPGHVHCLNCLDAMSLAQMKRRSDPEKSKHLKEREKQWRKNRMERLRAGGLCVGCGKVPARPGKTRCKRCAEIEAAKAQRKYWKRKERENESNID